jgi:hypothetical protein
MTIDPSAAFGLAALVMTALGTVFLVLARSSISFVLTTHAKELVDLRASHTKEIAALQKDRDEQEAECKAIAERTRLAELAIVRLEGSVGGHAHRLSGFETNQVPRAEWEQRTTSIEKQLGAIAERVNEIATVRTVPPPPSLKRRKAA